MNDHSLDFAAKLYWGLVEGLDLADAVEEAVNLAGWPGERDEIEGDTFFLAARRHAIERILEREEARLARAGRYGPTSELIVARARARAARERLSTL